MAQVIRLEQARRTEPTCQATTRAGRPCRNPPRANGFCARHQPPPPPERVGPFDAEAVDELLALVGRRLTGRYEVDEFGFDAELTERVLLPAMRPLYRWYWRADWLGIRHVPAVGPALLVGNHAGALPLDALVVKFGVLDLHPARRHVRLLAADLVFRLPVVAPLARKMGSTLACDEDALRLLSGGELVGVFPEGYKGIGKGWRNRYRLQRFGRGGFAEIALRTGAPIVPVAVVGSEEIYPMIHDGQPLARLLGLPYIPVTPFFPWLGPLGLVPLPSKWIVEFGEPIPTDGYAADAWQDPMLVFELTDRVRDTIQQMLYRNLIRRKAAFL
jgi:1-acyl-sn-glycerol-3-phosphate acyltransferase